MKYSCLTSCILINHFSLFVFSYMIIKRHYLNPLFRQYVMLGLNVVIFKDVGYNDDSNGPRPMKGLLPIYNLLVKHDVQQYCYFGV